ncbi:MAG: ribonuclease [Oxalobacteraceae bacterium]
MDALNRREMILNFKSLRNTIFFLIAILFSVGVSATDAAALATVHVSALPRQAQQVLVKIRRGGPFSYAKDGAVFGNYEQILPRRNRGYYHEYTVKTPDMRSRGARRIVAGGDPQASGEYYYTEDHYASFRRITE